MQTNRVGQLIPSSRLCGQRFRIQNSHYYLLLAAAIATAAPGLALAQQPETSLADEANLAKADAAVPPEIAEPATTEPATPESASAESATSAVMQPALLDDDTKPDPKPRKHTPESEIAVEGAVSYGNWEIFAAGIHEALYTGGFEYDRHSWGKFIGAQMDYAADFMPLVLLKEPSNLNPYGVRRSRPGDNRIIPGLAFSPIGLRMEWRHDKKFKPYFTVLGGAIGFTQKALSPDASYYDFTLHESIGFYLKMSQRVDMRFGLFGDFHFSNAYVTSYNPGLDVMNSNLAVSYHFGG
ncbi:acyloxyacyl hydrolase [Acidicapsa acidisoli]|uniref:acyloxyacyl hydrolase n=1 Tax=Acidicapsa acidisoli TaxID=1615681 RepID=UPI0021DF5DF6|nr:acyloxyacyl hydrolase [Acidicapsa acidisoli]